MKWKPAIAELAILLGIFMLATAFSLLFTSALFGNAALDINLHDTYFVGEFSWWIITLPPFFVLVVLVYLTRAIAGRFTNRMVNVVLTAGLFFNVLLLLKVYKSLLAIENMIMSSASGSVTLYPPLSALKDVQKPVKHIQESAPFSHVIFIILIVVLVLLVTCSVLTGKNWNVNKHELQKF
jgi:hypothetical protein